ncbi:MAG: DNA polymerase III subunit alpha [Bacilli bacterium]
MYVPLGVKTDNSILQSLIKIKDLIDYLKEHNITTCGILDNRLYGVVEFYFNCINNNIKPIIGLDVTINNMHLYLYAMNNEGYKSLLKINSLVIENDISFLDLKEHNNGILVIIPFASSELYDEISKIFTEIYIGYNSEYEKTNSLLITDKIVFINEILCFSVVDTKYLDYLHKIEEENAEDGNYEKNYFLQVNENDAKTTEEVASKLNVTIDTNKRYIPHFDENIDDSYNYLLNLSKKGLSKRLNGNIPVKYVERLKYELDIINKMGFVDYFLIVYDYVKFAKQNDILVGPGRGSAAGSLVSYVLGITNIDPIKYDLLFERFLNPERITMPDIDIDFEFTKRNEVINYVKGRYGKNRVANILTFSNLSSRQVIKDVARVLKFTSPLVDQLTMMFDPKENLKTNYKNTRVKDLISRSTELQEIYRISLKLEGLKRQTSTHAAGVVISSVPLDDVIPISYNDGDLQTGITADYLESLGLLKMDFLALKNLTIIKKVLELIKENTGEVIDINNIPLDDELTLKLFYNVDTIGIFQFESTGMMNFLRKLKVSEFSSITSALALYRPGPMDNIDTFIARKEGREKVTYPVPELESILKDTYGIMIYQEQIMQVLVLMGGYSFAEADNIRRAMSKKKASVMEQERDIFITRSVKNGYTEEKAANVYDLIVKFANYGFNKSHSVAYAIIAYQMAYLKSHYPAYFIANLLNMSIGSEVKTKEYIVEAKKKGVKIFRPDINKSQNEYLVNSNNLLLPFTVIKNVGSSACEYIVLERNKNGEYIDFYDFVSRTYGKSVNRKTLECLIDAGVFNSFKISHHTMYANIDNAITYAELRTDLDESLVMKPELEIKEEYDDMTLMSQELEVFGFYVTNHPSSKYVDKDIMKLDKMKQFFDKYVKTVVIIDSVKKIKTKKGEEMAFINASDETGSGDYVIFPKKNNLLNYLEKKSLYKITGQVTRRMDKYQIVITNIEKL